MNMHYPNTLIKLLRFGDALWAALKRRWCELCFTREEEEKSIVHTNGALMRPTKQHQSVIKFYQSRIRIVGSFSQCGTFGKSAKILKMFKNSSHQWRFDGTLKRTIKRHQSFLKALGS
jgi:hypothetical protein